MDSIYLINPNNGVMSCQTIQSSTTQRVYNGINNFLRSIHIFFSKPQYYYFHIVRLVQKISWKRIFMTILFQKGIYQIVTHLQSYRITITWLMCILPILCLKGRLKWLRNKIGWWVLVLKGGRTGTLLFINVAHPQILWFKSR